MKLIGCFWKESAIENSVIDDSQSPIGGIPKQERYFASELDALLYMPLHPLPLDASLIAATSPEAASGLVRSQSRIITSRRSTGSHDRLVPKSPHFQHNAHLSPDQLKWITLDYYT